MKVDALKVSTVLPTTPARLFACWLSGDLHAAFTGGAEARVDPRVGGNHSAWDGYITGKTLAMEPGKRIVQSWRSSDFPDDARDSRLEVILAPAKGGTKITIVHTEIPAGQGEQYEAGWEEHYFAPMRAFFAKETPPSNATKKTTKKKTKSAASPSPRASRRPQGTRPKSSPKRGAASRSRRAKPRSRG